MKSAIAHLGTQNFPRLRIGVGKAKDAHPDKDTVSHVLGRFSPDELPLISEVLHWTVGAVECSLKQGVERAMNLYNPRNAAGQSESSGKQESLKSDERVL
jgi:PTH1 family peptidyl-tRNA hydrolase